MKREETQPTSPFFQLRVSGNKQHKLNGPKNSSSLRKEVLKSGSDMSQHIEEFDHLDTD